MLSSQILQNTIDGLKNITRRDISIAERDGKIAASTESAMLNAQIDDIELFISSQAENQLIQGYQYFKVFDGLVAEYVVMIKGEDEETYRIGKITAFQVQSLLIAYRERYDKDNFIKNLLLDNLLLVDIYGRAKKLHIENAVPRIVYLIETDVDNDAAMVEIIRGIFPSKSKDFVTAIDEKSIILVKEISDIMNDNDTGDPAEQKEAMRQAFESVARTVRDTLAAEAMCNVVVGIGGTVSDLKNVSGSFKEARMALEVGKIFYPERLVVNYEQLGIGRLIYHLPPHLCKMFVSEILHDIPIELFDEEMFATVTKFFENSLNVSETSRQLYIHRNTLVYRLDKLQRISGLDLRNFEDAITFKIALMVSKYMAYKENYSL